MLTGSAGGRYRDDNDVAKQSWGTSVLTGSAGGRYRDDNDAVKQSWGTSVLTGYAAVIIEMIMMRSVLTQYLRQ